MGRGINLLDMTEAERIEYGTQCKAEELAVVQEKLTNYAKYRAVEYKEFLDPLTAEISRLKDEIQTLEVIEEIELLKSLRTETYNEIRLKYPKSS
jgi:hypothetical protein